jgi:hypothetical protein
MEDILIQAVEMDTGTWSPATSEVLLYIVRLVVRVESFIDLVLERARIDDDDDMHGVEEKEKEEEKEEEKKEKAERKEQTEEEGGARARRMDGGDEGPSPLSC